MCASRSFEPCSDSEDGSLDVMFGNLVGRTARTTFPLRSYKLLCDVELGKLAPPPVGLALRLTVFGPAKVNLCHCSREWVWWSASFFCLSGNARTGIIVSVLLFCVERCTVALTVCHRHKNSESSSRPTILCSMQQHSEATETLSSCRMTSR